MVHLRCTLSMMSIQPVALSSYFPSAFLSTHVGCARKEPVYHTTIDSSAPSSPSIDYLSHDRTSQEAGPT